MIVSADKHNFLAVFVHVFKIFFKFFEAAFAMLKTDEIDQICQAEDAATPEGTAVNTKRQTKYTFHLE